MTITEVKFRRFINEGKLRAVVSLTFDGSFAVHDIKIVQGEVLVAEGEKEKNPQPRRTIRKIERNLPNDCLISLTVSFFNALFMTDLPL